jgi:hypothetical protein
MDHDISINFGDRGGKEKKRQKIREVGVGQRRRGAIIIILSILAMPKSYLNSQPPPNLPSKDWLTWTRNSFERFIPNNSSKIAGIMGINKAGDIQSLYMPIIVPKVFTNEVDAYAIIGNVFNVHSKPLFICTNASDIGSATVIETFADVRGEIFLEQSPHARSLVDTAWAKATVLVGMVIFPTIAPISFGQTTIQGCIHDANFEENMESISPTHIKWAKLIKEHITQQENDNNDVITITNCLSKKSRMADNLKFAMIGFFEAYVPDSCFFSIFNLPNQEK